MKLTNHNKNNTYDIDTYVMRGTISMTDGEFFTAIKYLQAEYQKAVKNLDTYKRDSLSKLSSIHIDMKQTLCIGVEATRLLALKYHLKGYKDQNYGIEII